MELFDILAQPCTLGSGVQIDGKIVGIFQFLITMIKIGVPVLLVIWGSWDLGKAVMAQKDDEIKNAQKLFIKKLIVAVCVFLVPTFLSLVLNVIGEGNNASSTGNSCWSVIFS